MQIYPCEATRATIEVKKESDGKSVAEIVSASDTGCSKI